jgi:UDP-glucose 4-epimerase
VNTLITGGAGYIGGTVARYLLEAGHSVVVYDNLCHSQRSAVPEGSVFTEGDVGDQKRLEETLRTHRTEAVLHFAALIEAGESMHWPERYFSNNSASALALFQAMLATGVEKIVFSSTAAVYGEPEKTPIAEEAALHPSNPYGESKLIVEQMLRWMHTIHHFRYASLRYFNVAGAIPGRGESHEPESHLIPLILDVALGRRKSIRIYGTDYSTPDGTCIRDYIHVRDLARAHLMALAALEKQSSMIYNLGNGRGFSVREVIESARRVTGRPIPAEECPRRSGDPAVLVADSAKIGRELGWRPEYTRLDDIVVDAWQWHQERYR